MVEIIIFAAIAAVIAFIILWYQGVFDTTKKK